MTRFLSRTLGRSDIASARQAAVCLASASALLLLTLAPASAIEKRSGLSNAGSPAAAAAADLPQNETIKKVAQLIDGLGYKVKSSGADYIVIEANNLIVALEPAGDGSAVYASIYYQLPKEKRSMIPYEKILAYNGHSSDYFGTSMGANDQMSIALMNHLPTTLLAPRSLKELIDQLTTDATKNVALLDPSGWTSSLTDLTSK